MATRRATRRWCAGCGGRLPDDAGGRQRHCDPACVARAYRARRRIAETMKIEAYVIHAYAAPFRPGVTEADLAAADRIRATMGCPVCGTVVWKRTRRRRDAVYCSARCRTRAWRDRHATSVSG